MTIVNAIDALLSHIQGVQQDVIDRSKDSLLKMSSFIENSGLEVDENITAMLQDQDIVTQQLRATNEAIESIKESLGHYSSSTLIERCEDSESMELLLAKLTTILSEAKDKKNRFSGNHALEHDEEIEFF